MHRELLCYIGDVKNPNLYMRKKNFKFQEAQILYTLVVNILPVS